MTIIEAFSDIFSYSFMVRALIAGIGLACACALLGVSLVLKRYSMIGDGLSHVGFGALAVGSALAIAPMYVALPAVVICAFLLLRLNKTKVSGDSAIAILSSVSLAIGVISVSLSGTNIDLEGYMFGSILSLSRSDSVLCIVLAVVVIAYFILCYNRIFAITFDPVFQQAGGVRTGIYDSITALLTAITVVVGMRMMGTLLISSLIIFPCLTSMRVFRTFRKVCVSSAIVAGACFFVGMVLSYTWSLPTGASVVVVNALCLGLFSVIGLIMRRVNRR